MPGEPLRGGSSGRVDLRHDAFDALVVGALAFYRALGKLPLGEERSGTRGGEHSWPSSFPTSISPLPASQRG